MSKKGENSIIREHEKQNLKQFVDTIFSLCDNVSFFDNFYYSYSIPQISEEFDLLKFTDTKILNIEIKDELIKLEDICYQLDKNRYYLSHLEKEIVSVCYIAKEDLFFIKSDEQLLEIDKNEIKNILDAFEPSLKVDIDDMFKASKFLISPLNTPKKFLDGNYFLTNHQNEIKIKIEKEINLPQNKYFEIKGIAGTGKTLLLYDIAKNLSNKGRVCVIHGGILCDGHQYINDNSNIVVISAKEAMNTDYSVYDFIFIDESHRIYKSLFELLIASNKKLIFSLDSNQILSKAENYRNIPQLIANLPNLQSFVLTKKIRTNKELSTFIIRMFDLSKRDPNIVYKNVDLFYANNIDEARKVISYLRAHDYEFINYTPSKVNDDKLDYFKFLSDSNTHRVIGQEFDKVAMFIDYNFYYEDGMLNCKTHPNPDYIYNKLLYQGVTRVREKLAIIVLDNLDVYEKLVKIAINKE